MFDSRPYTLDRVIRLGLTLALIWGLIQVVGYLSDVLVPFAVALLGAYLLNPAVEFFERRFGGRRGLAVVVTLLLTVVVLVGAGWLVFPMISGEVAQMGRIVTNLATNASWAARLREWFSADAWDLFRSVIAKPDVQSYFASLDLMSLSEQFMTTVLPGVWNLISGAFGLVMGLMGLAAIILYLVLLLADFPALRDNWQNLIPGSWRGEVVGFMDDVNAGMSRYFRAQAVVASIVGILFAIGFSIIGLPMGIVLGLFIGLLNMVPYLQIVGLIPAFMFAVVRALETGTEFWMYPGLTLLIFAVVQAIQDGLLTPRIMGKAMGLSPAIMLLSLSIWGKFLGLLGLIIALPMTVILWAYYQRWANKVDRQLAAETAAEEKAVEV